jgi:hypothetical protein
MIEDIIKEMEYKVKWHEQLAESYANQEKNTMEEQHHWAASMAYLMASQIVRKHAAKAEH